MEAGEVHINEIMKKCLDSEGYILFAGYLTPEKDSEGRAVIEFQYRRYHFSLEDSKQAVQRLRDSINTEVRKLIAEDDGVHE